MREETADCIRPWDERDSALVAAAERWARGKPPAAARNTLAVCDRARRGDDEIALDSDEAFFVVVPAAERLILEAAFANPSEREARLILLCSLWSRRQAMSPRLRPRFESVVARGIEKRGLGRQWERALAVSRYRGGVTGEAHRKNGE